MTGKSTMQPIVSSSHMVEFFLPLWFFPLKGFPHKSRCLILIFDSCPDLSKSLHQQVSTVHRKRGAITYWDMHSHGNSLSHQRVITHPTTFSVGLYPNCRFVHLCSRWRTYNWFRHLATPCHGATTQRRLSPWKSPQRYPTTWGNYAQGNRGSMLPFAGLKVLSIEHKHLGQSDVQEGIKVIPWSKLTKLSPKAEDV